VTLPGLVVAGAPKCGTTSLYRWLADHPQACASRVKETRFFLGPDHVFRPRISCHTHGIEAYAAYFAHARGDERLVFEVTPDYLYDAHAVAALRALPGPPHVAFLFRRPSRRVYSLYQFARNNVGSLDPGVSFPRYVDVALGRTDAALLDGLPILRQAVAQSRYHEWLVPWLEAFPADRVHVFQFERLTRDPRAFMRALAERFGMDPGFYDDYGFGAENESYRVRNRAVHRLKRAVSRRVWERLSPAVRRRARTVYRALNTDDREVMPEDAAALALLDEQFAPWNRRLAASVPIDLELWG